MADWDDKSLMECLVAGKENAFREIYDRYYERLFYSCYGIVRNTHDAEDIVIVTLTKLFTRRERFETIAQLQNWLYLAARNRCFDLLRGRRVQAERDEKVRELFAPDAENQALNSELDVLLIEKIMALVGELPPQSQQVIRLRYLEGLKYKEISEKLQISPRTVENLLRYALDRLRRRLGDEKLALILVVLEAFLQ
jgi:RNA polymerase sigma-70 factor (ECF subfamily)